MENSVFSSLTFMTWGYAATACCSFSAIFVCFALITYNEVAGSEVSFVDWVSGLVIPRQHPSNSC
jgi:hypothetical protein